MFTRLREFVKLSMSPSLPSCGVTGNSTSRFMPALLILNFIFFFEYIINYSFKLSKLNGVMINSVTPLGSDFVNLWAVGRLVLQRAVETIYHPEAFMHYQLGFTHGPVGFRLWVYPPTSLLFAWPIGLVGYVVGFAVWTLLGVAVLAYCARRFGFDWRETAILVCSPASLACIVDGQTSNIFTGLLLIAFSPRSLSDPRSILATTLITLKPQMGFLIPVVWLRQGRWRLVLWTSLAITALLALSVVIFGLGPWIAYFDRVRPVFADYLRHGSGPYMLMYPSVFMAMRNLSLDGSTAFAVHVVFALPIIAILLWRLLMTKHANTQMALVLVGTSLITPYLHTYDLTMLLVAGFLILRSAPEGNSFASRMAAAACFATWIAPILTKWMAAFGVPLMPLILLGVFFAIRDPDGTDAQGAGRTGPAGTTLKAS